MKRYALAAALILASTVNVACNNKKKEATLQEKIHACMWDSTGQCQKAAAAYASSPAVLPIANQVLAQNPGLLNGVGGTTPVVLPPGTPGTNVGTGTAIRTASADDAAVRAMAAKVSAAIEADNNNPNSLRYDPPQQHRAPASVAGSADVRPASAGSPAPSVNYDAYVGGSADGVR